MIITMSVHLLPTTYRLIKSKSVILESNDSLPEPAPNDTRLIVRIFTDTGQSKWFRLK